MPKKTTPVKVDPEEYAALVHLRDVTHEALRSRLDTVENSLRECRKANQSQLDSIVKSDLRETHLLAEIKRLESLVVVK